MEKVSVLISPEALRALSGEQWQGSKGCWSQQVSSDAEGEPT